MTLLDQKKSNKEIISKVIQGIRKDKVLYLKLLWAISIGYLATKIKNKHFTYNEKNYAYFYHPYNHTWANERAVEVPIVMSQVTKAKNILEIGNVLRSYFPLKHTVIDKYEKGQHILNEDAVDFKLNKKFDLIVSISTIEHVGWDEQIKDATKIPRTIAHLKKHLTKNGKLLITVPVGYNPHLDALLRQGILGASISYLERGWFGIWKQVARPRKKTYEKGIAARTLAIIQIS